MLSFLKIGPVHTAPCLQSHPRRGEWNIRHSLSLASGALPNLSRSTAGSTHVRDGTPWGQRGDVSGPGTYQGLVGRDSGIRVSTSVSPGLPEGALWSRPPYQSDVRSDLRPPAVTRKVDTTTERPPDPVGLFLRSESNGRTCRP